MYTYYRLYIYSFKRPLDINGKKLIYSIYIIFLYKIYPTILVFVINIKYDQFFNAIIPYIPYIPID